MQYLHVATICALGIHAMSAQMLAHTVFTTMCPVPCTSVRKRCCCYLQATTVNLLCALTSRVAHSPSAALLLASHCSALSSAAVHAALSAHLCSSSLLKLSSVALLCIMHNDRARFRHSQWLLNSATCCIKRGAVY
jgi:hypothetical protein